MACNVNSTSTSRGETWFVQSRRAPDDAYEGGEELHKKICTHRGCFPSAIANAQDEPFSKKGFHYSSFL